jgi:hypothetical protein
METLPIKRFQSVDEHERAVKRLEEAMKRQAELTETYQRSLGTSRELDAYMRVREARRQVSAFDKWLCWVDDEDVSTAPPAGEVPLEEVLGH